MRWTYRPPGPGGHAGHCAGHQRARRAAQGRGRAFVAGATWPPQADPVQGAADLLAPLNQALLLLQGPNARSSPRCVARRPAPARPDADVRLRARRQGTKFNLACINLGTSCDVGASWALPRLVGPASRPGDRHAGRGLRRRRGPAPGAHQPPAARRRAGGRRRAFAQRLASGPTPGLYTHAPPAARRAGS